MYDSVIALGIAACETSNPYFSGEELFESIRNVRFIGATSHFAIDQDTSSRSSVTTMYRVLNIRTGTELSKNGTLGFDLPTAYEPQVWDWSADVLDHEWVPVHGVDLRFSDGSTIPPAPLPPLEENKNLIGSYLIIPGLVICLFIGGSAIWFALSLQLVSLSL